MARILVIGAGAMGLAAAWQAARDGHQVTVLEADRIPGGMAAHFDFGGLSIERFYHFICKTDFATFKLLDELGISERLKWRDTSMGFYIDGALHEWGNPIALLRFPGLSFADRLRYGWQAFRASKRTDWSDLHGKNVREWITAEAGQQVWNKMWKRSFELKFHEYTDQVAAPWLGVRIRRLAASRKSVFQEVLGYLEGGSEVLVDALVKGIEANGGKVVCGEAARQCIIEDGRVHGVLTHQGRHDADAVICTAPLAYAARLLPDEYSQLRQRYEAILNIGAVCVVLKLKRQVTPHFWVNINDPEVQVPGIVEFSRLRPVDPDHIVYVPFYMPREHARFTRPDGEFVSESLAAIRKVNPQISEADLIDAKVGRLQYAQPVCQPNFPDLLPPVQTPIAGLQIADTCFYYPEDRGISESVRLGREMAVAAGQQSATA
jgi:protoporphyrinogen oxidase